MNNRTEGRTLDSEYNCGAETGSMSVIKVPNTGEIKAVEVMHECRHEDGHDGEHRCLTCGVTWTDEVPC